MLKKIRDNLYVADKKVTKAQLTKAKISVVVVAADKFTFEGLPNNCIYFSISLRRAQVNRPHVKDIACHIPKYMVQSGERVAIISPGGVVRAAWVAARAVCEMEDKTIYEIFQELAETLPGFKIGEAYL